MGPASVHGRARRHVQFFARRSSGLLVVAAALGSSACRSAPAPSAGSPSQTYLVTADQAGSSATVVAVDSGRILRTLPTTVGPHEATASSDGRWVVVSNYGDGGTVGTSLLAIDGRTLEVADTLDLGGYRRPHGMAFLPGDSLLLVTVELDSAVLVVRFPSGEVRSALPTGQWVSHMLAAHPDGRRVYTANIVDATVSEMDIQAGSLVRTAPVGPAAEAIGITPDGSEIWVGSNSEHTVTVLDTETLSPIATMPAAGFPYRIVFTPDGSTGIVTQPEAGLVRLFDVASHEETGTIPVAGAPAGIALSRDGSLAYVTRNEADSVAVVSLASREVLAMLPAGPTPDGIVVLEGVALEGIAEAHDDGPAAASVESDRWPPAAVRVDPAAGYSFPAPMMRVRMATVDDSGLNELLVIYMESLAWSGVTEDELEASESRRDEVFADLLRRAADGMALR